MLAKAGCDWWANELDVKSCWWWWCWWEELLLFEFLLWLFEFRFGLDTELADPACFSLFPPLVMFVVVVVIVIGPPVAAPPLMLAILKRPPEPAESRLAGLENIVLCFIVNTDFLMSRRALPDACRHPVFGSCR